MITHSKFPADPTPANIAAPQFRPPEDCIAILKRDRLIGDLLRRELQAQLPSAEVKAFQLGMDALEWIQATGARTFVTDLYVADMDGIEHLEPFEDDDTRILILADRSDVRVLDLLRKIRFDAIFDERTESLDDFRRVFSELKDSGFYVSECFRPLLKPKRNITKDNLTPTQEVVVSLLGMGLDNQTACEKLGVSPLTIASHRRRIMRKLRVHHKGELMLWAMQSGYVDVRPEGAVPVGFHAQIFPRLRRPPVVTP